MRFVEPKVYFIGGTLPHWGDGRTDVYRTPGIVQWLGELGGLNILASMQGSGPEKLVELAARRCYKSFDVGLNPNVNRIRSDSAVYLNNILASRHGSVLENIHSTWAFENVSRVMTHELCRNRVGIKDKDSEDDLRIGEFGLSQESMRYVRLNDIPIWLPPDFSDDEFAKGKITEAILYLEHLNIDLGRHFGIDNLPFSEKKRLTSAMRRMLPMGIGTGIVWTSNFRALRWLIEQRTEEVAEVEYRLVFGQVARMAVEMWPLLFGDFQENERGEWVPKHRKV